MALEMLRKARCIARQYWRAWIETIVNLKKIKFMESIARQ